MSGAPAPEVAKIEPLALARIIPNVPTKQAFVLGQRLTPEFIKVAVRETDPEQDPTFTVSAGMAEISYGIDDRNRIQAAMYKIPVEDAKSEAAFAEMRRSFERTLGAPTLGRRIGDQSLILNWTRADGSGATLSLAADDSGLNLHALLVGAKYGRAFQGLAGGATGPRTTPGR